MERICPFVHGTFALVVLREYTCMSSEEFLLSLRKYICNRGVFVHQRKKEKKRAPKDCFRNIVTIYELC